MYYLTEAGRSFLQLRELMDVGPAIQKRQADLDIKNAPPKTVVGKALNVVGTGLKKAAVGAGTVAADTARHHNVRSQINTPL